MVSFDAAQPGTPEETWAADTRLTDRSPLPLDGIDQLLVVAAHPDDETLGAGGLIVECARRGYPVTVVIVTDGAAAPEAGDTAACRAAELRNALAVLAPAARLHQLGIPDGRTREERDRVRERLAPVIGETPTTTLVAAPWRGDGHRDHRVVGEVVAALTDERMLIEYPIWMWHWATPSSPDVPWDSMCSLAIDLTAKSAAIDNYRSQTAGDSPMLRADTLDHFRRDREYFIVNHKPVERDALPARYFDNAYSRRADPWGFENRWYEQRKRDVTVASLPDRRYHRALEIGCSIGVLTDALADRSDELLAIDVSQAAVDQARERLGMRAQVERVDVVESFPTGRFDLIVLSEVGYYFSPVGLARVLDAIEAGLTPGGTLIACHWRHPVADYPLSGDEVHETIRSRGLPLLVSHREADFVLEVFSTDNRSVARREGLVE